MKIDLDEVQEGLISLSTVIIVFSVAIMVISIMFKPYLVLEPCERDYIVIVCGINIPFCIYYLIEAIRISSISGLDQKYTSKFILRTGIISIFYIPQLVSMMLILLADVNLIEKVIVFVVLVLEMGLVGLIIRLVIEKLRDIKRE